MKLTNFLQDLGSPVAYYPRLSNITGGVKETLFLCQLLYWQGKQSDKDGWIYKTQNDIFNETGLTRYEQEAARKSLVSRGFIDEKRRGIPAKMHYKINIDAINEAWEAFISNEYDDNDLSCPQTSMRKTSKLGCGKPANYIAENQQTITENTTENTTEIYSNSNVANISSANADTLTSHRNKIPFDDIIEAYNTICKSMPRVKILTDKRRKSIKTAWTNFNCEINKFDELFKLAEKSDFLSGRSGKWNGCNFDWLINYNNAVKVLEGTYNNDNKKSSSYSPYDDFDEERYKC